jgi:hypothetical protein
MLEKLPLRKNKMQIGGEKGIDETRLMEIEEG